MWWVQSLVALSPHHTWTLPGHGNRLLCGSVCVRDRMEVHVVSFLYLSWEYSVGNRLALSWPSRRQESSLILLTGQHISQPPEPHRPSLPLRSPSAAEWRSKDSWVVLGPEDADMETRAHPSVNTLTNVPLNCSFYPPLLLTCRLTDKAPSDLFLLPWRGVKIFMCVHVILFVLSAVACGKLWTILQQLGDSKEMDIFPFLFRASFRELQIHNVLW